MRTNIDLDDDLLRRAAEIAGTKTKKSTVEYALQELIDQRSLADFLDYAGTSAETGRSA